MLRTKLLFRVYTEQVIREAEITYLGAVIGGGYISNLRYAYDTALCSKSPQEINNIVHEVNDAGRILLLKLNARTTKTGCSSVVLLTLPQKQTTGGLDYMQIERYIPKQ